MEDGGASFAELEKEVDALKRLKPLILWLREPAS